jgi:flagellar motor switch protein FliN
MSDTDGQVPLPDLNSADAPPLNDVTYNEEDQAARIASDLEAVFDVPVQVSAVLGRSKMDVGELLKLGPGTVLELVEDKLGVTMTEIIKAERT